MKNFIRNLEYGNHDLMISQADQRVWEHRATEVTTMGRYFELLTEEYARLMDVPADQYAAYCADILHGFIAALDPSDPLLTAWNEPIPDADTPPDAGGA